MDQTVNGTKMIVSRSGPINRNRLYLNKKGGEAAQDPTSQYRITIKSKLDTDLYFTSITAKNKTQLGAIGVSVKGYDSKKTAHGINNTTRQKNLKQVVILPTDQSPDYP